MDKFVETPFDKAMMAKLTQLIQAMEHDGRRTLGSYWKVAGADFSIIHDQATFYRQLDSDPILRRLFPDILDVIGNGQIRCYSMPLYDVEDLQTLCLSHKTNPEAIVDFAIPAIEIGLWVTKRFLFDPSAESLVHEDRPPYADRFLKGKVENRLALTERQIQASPKFKSLSPLREATIALLRAEEIELAGRRLLSPDQIFAEITSNPAINDALFPSRVGTIFGDLHPENLGVAFNEKELSFFKLLDARGFPYPADFAYDIGKILHSFNAKYDFIHHGLWGVPLDQVDFDGRTFRVDATWATTEAYTVPGRGGSIDRGTKLVYTGAALRMTAYDVVTGWLTGTFLPKLMTDDPTCELRAEFHSACHLLTMLPHHVEAEPEHVWLFYLRGIECLNDWYEAAQRQLATLAGNTQVASLTT